MPSSTPIHKLLDQFIDYRRSLNHSPRTLYSQTRELSRFIAWLQTTWHVNTPDRLRKKHLLAFQHHLINYRTAKGKPIKPGTINNRVKAVRNFMCFLHNTSYTTTNLASAIGYVKEPRFLPTSVLEHAQMRKLLRSIDTTTAIGYRNRTIMEILYSCALRCGEFVALTLADVDLEQATLTVIGKGQKQRVVPIGKTALRFLETYIKAIRPFWRNSHITQALFLNHYGKSLKEQTLQQTISHCCARAPVRVTPHTFRRSCTTELIRGNANLYHVKDFLGHASLDTLKAYTKLTINDLKKTHARCHPREKDK